MKNVFHFMLKVWKCVRWPHYSLLICFVRLYRSQKQLFYIYIFNFFFLNLLPEYFKFEFSFPKSWDFSETCLKPLCLVRHKTTFWQQITLIWLYLLCNDLQCCSNTNLNKLHTSNRNTSAWKRLFTNESTSRKLQYFSSCHKHSDIAGE